MIGIGGKNELANPEFECNTRASVYPHLSSWCIFTVWENFRPADTAVRITRAIL